jgi:hypothetical protein
MVTEPESAGDWCTVAEAARALGVTERAVRRRIARGTLDSRRAVTGNRVLTLVRLPADTAPEPGRNPPDAAALAELAALRATVAALERHIADLRAELARRRWPGLWPAMVRFWRGEG